jgi:hypothetical protein
MGNTEVLDWGVRIPRPGDGYISAFATDETGNAELTAHRLPLANPVVALRQPVKRVTEVVGLSADNPDAGRLD